MVTDEAIYAELQSSDINSEYHPQPVFLLPKLRVMLPPQSLSRSVSQRPFPGWSPWDTLWSGADLHPHLPHTLHRASDG